MKLNEIIKFINETTGQAAVKPREALTPALPQYIKSLYDFEPVTIHKADCIIAILKKAQLPKTAELQKHASLIKQKLNAEAIFAFESVNTKRRERLTNHLIPYVALDSEIYLPFLMLKIKPHAKREGFRKAILSPWAQILVTRQLVYQDIDGLTGTSIADRFDITKMTTSRAINELESANLCYTITEARRKILRFEPSKDLWPSVIPYIRSPVHSIVYVDSLPKDIRTIKTATSALGEVTHLSPPESLEVAIDKRIWTKIGNWKTKNSNKICVHIWHWDPRYTANGDVADPISVYLTLLHSTDERVSMARDEYLRTTDLQPITSEE